MCSIDLDARHQRREAFPLPRPMATPLPFLNFPPARASFHLPPWYAPRAVYNGRDPLCGRHPGEMRIRVPLGGAL